MTKYILKRLGYMVLTLWIIITLTFVMMHSLPVDPFSSPKITPAIQANLRAKFKTDLPLYQQYIHYMGNLLKGDLGISMRHRNRTVNELIEQHFPVSAELGFWALIYSVTGGLLLGVIAALKRNHWQDRVAMIIAIIGISVPSFVLAVLLQLLFGVQWQKWFGHTLLPVAGWGQAKHIILPALMLGMGTLAVYARMMRSSMLDVLSQDYIRTARAKGLSSFEIVSRHTLRNALLPIITLLGTTVINVLSGSLIIEQIFGIPGLGKYFVQSITDSDYTLILGTTVFYGALLVVAMFLVDVAYGFVDPRIRLMKGKA